jgi:plastocyanin
MCRMKVALLALLSTVMAGRAEAKDYTVILHHMELDSISETLSVGDVVTFDNKSDMAHNLYITYSDGTVDNLDTQFPGMKRRVTLRQAGATRIKCWIHPIINLEFTIAPKPGAETETPKE